MIRLQIGVIVHQQIRIWNQWKSIYTQTELDAAKLSWGYTIAEFDQDVRNYIRNGGR